MSGRPVRHVAALVGRLLPHVYPGDQSSWARAMRFEIEAVEGDGAALIFALGCLWGGVRERCSGLGEGVNVMRIGGMNAGAIGILCAFAATCLGILYLVAAGAPLRYPVVNAAAFLLGLVALRGLIAAGAEAGRHLGALLVVLGASMLAVALLGSSADGAARWIWVGPLSVQLSLVLLPAMLVAFARSPDALGSLGIGIAAAALALQPDRAMAGVLALGLAVLAATRPSRASIGVLAIALGAFAISLFRPDSLPAVPFVDEILFTSFDVHPLAGIAVLLGVLLLLVPAFAARRSGPASLVFGAVWLGCIAAAALGNYPTPVVGYGGSAILGYLLSLVWLPDAGLTRTADDLGPIAPRSASRADRSGEDRRAALEATASRWAGSI